MSHRRSIARGGLPMLWRRWSRRWRRSQASTAFTTTSVWRNWRWGVRDGGLRHLRLQVERMPPGTTEAGLASEALARLTGKAAR